jgi:hypothetical protein
MGYRGHRIMLKSNATMEYDFIKKFSQIDFLFAEFVGNKKDI